MIATQAAQSGGIDVSIYLGLDSSTQSLTATVIEVEDPRGSVVATRTFQFDEALPAYGTRHGVLPSHSGAVVHAPPLMWAEALESCSTR